MEQELQAAAPVRTGVAGMLQDRNARAVSRPWQLLQVAPTATPGLFKVRAVSMLLGAYAIVLGVATT